MLEMDVVWAYGSESPACNVRTQASILRQRGSKLRNKDNPELDGFHGARGGDLLIWGDFVLSILMGKGSWVSGLLERKPRFSLAVALGSWEYFTAGALFLSINAFQTCSLLGTVICGSPLCRAHALAPCREDVSVMILGQWWQFREMFFKFIALLMDIDEFPAELWITKKMGSDSGRKPGSKMDLPWRRLCGAYVQSRCAR